MAKRNVNFCLSRLDWRLAATALLVICGSLAAQELYKWTDENGNVHYGDKPPAGAGKTSNAQKVESSSANRTITKIPVSVEESVESDISRFVLLANPIFSSHSQTPSRLVVVDDTLWLTFEDSLLSFDPKSNTSTKYKLDRIRFGLSGQKMRISRDKFIFFALERSVSVSAFHVYDQVNDSYRELALRVPPNYIISYEDRYDDGIFGFDFQSKSIVQYPDVSNIRGESAVREFEYLVENLDGGIHALSVNMDSIWYFTGYKKNCTVGYFKKRKSTGEKFRSDEIGLPASNGCAFIVADDDEVWVTSIANGRDTSLAVYDIGSGAWEVLETSRNDIDFSVSPLKMDTERVYYKYCDKLIAVNRESRVSKVFPIDGDPVDRKTHCIHDFNINDGNVWALVFEPFDHRKYPVLYRIPAEKMDP